MEPSGIEPATFRVLAQCLRILMDCSKWFWIQFMRSWLFSIWTCESKRYCYVMPCRITVTVHLLITLGTICSRRRLTVKADTMAFQWPISKQIHYFAMDVAAYTHSPTHTDFSVCGFYSIASTKARNILYFAQLFCLVRGMCLRSVCVITRRDSWHTACFLPSFFLFSNKKLVKQCTTTVENWYSSYT